MPKFSVILENSPEKIELTIFNLCSHQGSGDYEVIPDRELNLDLLSLKDRIISSHFLIEGVNQEICLAKREQLFLTIYPTGRIILEEVRPDQPEIAFQILQEILPISIFFS